MSDEGLKALQRAVTAIRGAHRSCGHGSTTVCNLGGCPWPNMHEEDVNELNEALAACGYAVTKVDP